jgi:hypothetical protein
MKQRFLRPYLLPTGILLGAAFFTAAFAGCSLENNAEIETITASRSLEFASPLDTTKILDHYEAVGAKVCCYANTDGSSGAANPWGDDCPPEKAIDNDTDTFWSSNYEGGADHGAGWDNRHWITIDLGEVKTDIPDLRFYFRSADRAFTDYELYASELDDLGAAPPAEKMIKTGTLSPYASPSTIQLDTPINARYIQLRCKTGNATTEQAINEFVLPFPLRVEGFAGIDTSYLETAAARGTEILPQVKTVAGTTKLSALLFTAKDLLAQEQPENIFFQVDFQKELDATAKDLIAFINAFAPITY